MRYYGNEEGVGKMRKTIDDGNVKQVRETLN